MATKNNASKHAFDTSDLLDLADESKLGKGAKISKKKASKKKSSKKKSFKLKKPVGPLDSLNQYGK